jgi:tryptophan synthase beta subunit
MGIFHEFVEDESVRLIGVEVGHRAPQQPSRGMSRAVAWSKEKVAGTPVLNIAATNRWNA